ncbi:flagellar hook-length control protein FliK [Moorella naiadis]|uniref:flagellar hook-length control protein FliK n=1 Tax=Moorella naiadis (nom. illeg.) TaxID=3093670 RepID=UPI003D9C92A5
MTVESLVRTNNTSFPLLAARSRGRYGEGAGDFGSLLAGLLQQASSFMPAGGLAAAYGEPSYRLPDFQLGGYGPDRSAPKPGEEAYSRPEAGAWSRLNGLSNRYDGSDEQTIAAGSRGREEVAATQGTRAGEAQPASAGEKASSQAGDLGGNEGQKPAADQVGQAGKNGDDKGKAAGSDGTSGAAPADQKAATSSSKSPATVSSAGKAGTPGTKRHGTTGQVDNSDDLNGTAGKQADPGAPGTPSAAGRQPEAAGKPTLGKAGLDGQTPTSAAGAGRPGEQQAVAGNRARNGLNSATAKGEEARIAGAAAKAGAKAGQPVLAARHGASTVNAGVTQAGNERAGSPGNTTNPGSTGKADTAAGSQTLIPGSQLAMKDGPLAAPGVANQGAAIAAGQAGTAGSSAGNRGSASHQEPGGILHGSGSGVTDNSQTTAGPVSFTAVLEGNNLPANGQTAGVTNLPEVIASALTAARLARTGSQRELELQLQPENLGSLKLRASLEGGRINLHLLVESGEAARALQAAVPEMRQAVAGQGLRLDQVQVQVGGDGQAGEHQNGSNGGYHQDSGRQPQSPLWPEAAITRDTTGNYHLNYLA